MFFKNIFKKNINGKKRIKLKYLKDIVIIMEIYDNQKEAEED